jgi:hypothetical protein
MRAAVWQPDLALLDGALERSNLRHDKRSRPIASQ